MSSRGFRAVGLLSGREAGPFDRYRILLRYPPHYLIDLASGQSHLEAPGS